MKYSLPKIDTIFKAKAVEAYNDAVREYSKLGIKKNSDIVKLIFSSLSRAFSTINNTTLSKLHLVKDEPPRTSPSSSHYNSFIRAISVDVDTLFNTHNEIEKSITNDFNYSQSLRNNMNGMVARIKQKVIDFSILTNPVNSVELWFKETFETKDRMDKEYGYAYDKCDIDGNGGALTLGYGDSEDVLTINNIKEIDESTITYDKEFKYSAPYHGRRYGVWTMDGTVSDESPRSMAVSKDWKKRSIANIVDPDEVDTFWEVEITAREDVLEKSFANNDIGQYFFLKDAGEKDGVNQVTPTGKVYTYKNGSMYYLTDAYRKEFFVDKNKKQIKRKLGASVIIRLNDPKSVSSISINRKIDSNKTISGKTHATYVKSIEVKSLDIVTGAESGWRHIQLVPSKYKSDDRSVNVDVNSKFDETRTVYHFPIESNVIAFRINLYTDEPYKIRYSVGKIKNTVKTWGGLSKKTVTTFLQFDERGIPTFGEINKILGIKLPDHVKLPDEFLKSKVPFNSIHTQARVDDSDMYRWAISISDISAYVPRYNAVGEFVSIPYESPKPIDRILLYTNDEFNDGSIEYYIVTEGEEPTLICPWEQPDRLDDLGRYVPKIIYFNSDIPFESRSNSKYGTVSFIDTDKPVYKVRLMILMKRNTNEQSTPKVYDYKLRVIPKSEGGLVNHVDQ